MNARNHRPAAPVHRPLNEPQGPNGRPDAPPLPPAWDSLIRVYLAECAQTGTKPTTLTARRGHLRRLALDHPHHAPGAITAPDLLRWLDSLDLAHATRRGIRYTVRGFFAWAQARGYVSTSPARHLPPIPRIAPPEGQDVPGLDDPHAQDRAPVRRTGPVAAPIPPMWEEAITGFMAFERIQGRATTSRKKNREQLAHLARTIPNAENGPWSVTTPTLLQWYTDREIALETRHSLRTTLRAFYAWGVAAGHLTTSPADVIPPVRRPGPNPHPLPDDLLGQALAAADARQTLILRCAAEAGLRRAEIAAIHARDLLQTSGGTVLAVHGKGSKQRLVPLAPGLAALLTDATNADPHGDALPNGQGSHLSAERVADSVRHLIPSPYTLHALRHRFATTAYDATRDLFSVQRLLGHASPTTTQRYVATDADQLRAVVAAVAQRSEYAALPHPIPGPERGRNRAK